MMKISRSGAAGSTGKASAGKPAKKAQSADKVFSVGSGTVDAVDEADAAAGAGSESLGSGVAAVGIESLLALQETQLGDEHQQTNQQNWQYGHGLLQQLQQLQQELLFGQVTMARLESIRQFMRAHQVSQAAAHPGIREVIAHIETRVAVELAKYGQDLP